MYLGFLYSQFRVIDVNSCLNKQCFSFGFVTCGATGVVCCELLATDGVALDATDVGGVASSLAEGVDVTALSCFELLVFVGSVI